MTTFKTLVELIKVHFLNTLLTDTNKLFRSTVSGDKL